ncbi:MAG: imidazole glycerol phosphate synthase subunit HisH [Actinomycetota bacterium]|nr:imidazole glycerol phosphate synthase subunit HisH [Actinomycetota bacterium]
MGNRRSVQKALEHVGAQAEITSEADRIEAADGVIVPGVGAFPRAMANLLELELAAPLRRVAAQGKPLLGICLGMQLLFDGSDEFRSTPGLGLIDGTVTPLRAGALRIPHIGWNDVRWERATPLSAGLPVPGTAFYHVHSLVARPSRGEDVIATTEYGERFATIVARGSVLGVQFHPEKSSARGLRMLANFAGLCRSWTRSDQAAPALRA